MNMHNIIVLIFCVLGYTQLLISRAEILLPEEIVGGHEAAMGTLTFYVTIQASNEHICGGGVLTNLLVAAAAHCIVNERFRRFQYKSYKVIVTSDFSSRQYRVTSVPVVKVYLPFSFNVTLFVEKTVFEAEEDFVILQLKRELGIGPIPALKALQLYDTTFHPENYYMIAGYGVHGLFNNGTYFPMDGKLRYAEVEMVSNHDCSIIYNENIPDYLFCARVARGQNRIAGTCLKDTGSPLVKNYETIIGILVQNPESCNDSDAPSIYMKVSYYLPFVENIISGDTSNTRVYILTQYASRFRFEEDLTSLG